MKWFKITILFLVSLLTILVAIFETKPGQRFLQKQLLQILGRLPIQIEIGQINNFFPNNIDLTDVYLSFDNTTVQIAHLHMRLALLPLWKKEWVIEMLEGEGMQLELFPDQLFSFKTRVEKKQKGPIRFTDLLISNSHLQIRGDLILDEEQRFARAHIQLQTEWIETPLSASGTIEGFWAPSSFAGSIDAKGQFFQEPWTLKTPFSVTETKGTELGPFHVQSPLVSGEGHLFWQNGHFTGQGNVKELTFHELHVKEANFQSDSNQMLTINVREAKWRQFSMDTATLSAAKGEKNWIGILSLEGPLIQANLRAYWRPQQVIIEEATGQYLAMPFHLETPSFIQWSEEILSIKPFGLRLGEEGFARFSMFLNNHQLHLTSDLTVRENPLASLDLQLPIQSRSLNYNAPVLARFFLNGKIEDFFDLFPLGMHRFGGTTACKFSLKGTLNAPQLDGNCTIEHGFYENYLTGTELVEVTAEIQGKDDRFYLTSFTAQDLRKKGHCTATGNLHFSPARHFPFHAEIDFTRLTVVQIDLIETEAEGHLVIDGDIRSALAKGQIEIIESEITIPDKIPRSYPDLQVVYKHATQPPLPPPPTTPYPLNLDVTINAPEGIFIDGRGLQSEWHGQFVVNGTFANPSAQGKLELTKGEFSFASRRFKLIEGTLSLKGKAYELPHINIAATTTEKGVTITAHLVGPLNKPQITFQSSPPLPMSSIFSYLLFGQDLSEVSGIQALQLASTVATFAGEGPDILELTRKSLGIDRLQIVMTPTGTAGEETLSLQVGKIVFPGFLVIIKQGADDSSPNIAIEVDLTHGFTFEAESEQQPAQGKFSLQWNLNY
jgi:hypothetical protein